ncbi:MAG: DUF2953 domain-containing protein [Defluviitaleaceae bacterium]|nr:DUF2953 domain-containing protein [Defluviitaleaceae bacterium]
MIAFVLNVLGFIALVFLWVLLLGIALFALVMFVPIRYKCEGDVNGWDFSGSARISWLFGIIAVALEPDQVISLHIMGIRVWRSVNNNINEDSDTETPAEQAAADGEPAVAVGKPDTKPKESKRAPKAEGEKLTDTIKSVWQNFESIKNYPDKSEIVSQIVLLTKRVLSTALPERLDLHGVFGFDDPCNTGLATGAISVFETFAPQRIRLSVAPDFSRKILELKLLVKGKISAVSMVIPFCRFLFSKPIWKLVKQLLKFRKKLRRKSKPKNTPAMQE